MTMTGIEMSTIGISRTTHDESTREKYNVKLDFYKDVIKEFAPMSFAGKCSRQWDLITQGKVKIHPMSERGWSSN